jgi:DNA-binding MarR family transcriptional regulator
VNVPLLIDALVRQMTVLLAQVATSGGTRAPLSHIANQVFVELANELSAQGVSRKVSADMFGMALRAYVRKVRRLNDSQTDQGRTLWKAVLDYLQDGEPKTRDQILTRFSRDDESQVRSVLQDLTDSGLVFISGDSAAAIYRATSDAELLLLKQASSAEGLTEFVWVLAYREGPITVARLARKLRMSEEDTAGLLEKLSAQGRVQATTTSGVTAYTATDFSVPLEARTGWEAAVLDHFRAVVQTIAQRLENSSRISHLEDIVGGSTYSFDVWPGHPFADEVKSVLKNLRSAQSALRKRVEAFNATTQRPADYSQIVVYVGQCVMPRNETDDAEGNDDEN